MSTLLLSQDQVESLNAAQSNVYLWLGLILESKGDMEEAMNLYNEGCNINQLWIYLLQHRIRALANSTNEEVVILLQKSLIEKFSYDPVLQKERYGELARLYWFLGKEQEAILAALKSGNQGLVEFFKTKDITRLILEANDFYNKMKTENEYVSNMWIGIEFAKAGAREKALEFFNLAIEAKEPAITLLLVRHYDFLNIKYLNLVPLARKIRMLIQF